MSGGRHALRDPKPGRSSGSQSYVKMLLNEHNGKQPKEYIYMHKGREVHDDFIQGTKGSHKWKCQLIPDVSVSFNLQNGHFILGAVSCVVAAAKQKYQKIHRDGSFIWRVSNQHIFRSDKRNEIQNKINQRLVIVCHY